MAAESNKLHLLVRSSQACIEEAKLTYHPLIADVALPIPRGRPLDNASVNATWTRQGFLARKPVGPGTGRGRSHKGDSAFAPMPM